jgi:hypothetical protein
VKIGNRNYGQWHGVYSPSCAFFILFARVKRPQTGEHGAEQNQERTAAWRSPFGEGAVRLSPPAETFTRNGSWGHQVRSRYSGCRSGTVGGPGSKVASELPVCVDAASSVAISRLAWLVGKVTWLSLQIVYISIFVARAGDGGKSGGIGVRRGREEGRATKCFRMLHNFGVHKNDERAKSNPEHDLRREMVCAGRLRRAPGPNPSWRASIEPPTSDARSCGARTCSPPSTGMRCFLNPRWEPSSEAYGFFVGEPDYDPVKSAILEILQENLAVGFEQPSHAGVATATNG